MPPVRQASVEVGEEQSTRGLNLNGRGDDLTRGQHVFRLPGKGQKGALIVTAAESCILTVPGNAGCQARVVAGSRAEPFRVPAGWGFACMYFKRIALHGFKSFADATVLELSPGITCVVGPNGSGKSNILDALRWALGEQSAKALRGSSMQDVIFNGTAHRPAMGMAEVRLGFDNNDGQLPIDYGEVEVCRRVYRDGESEYLINQTPCRLRDIQELFMDTGIGTNAYSLIGQGKVDMIISSRPEDRRFLFEEAAGIIKYKTRKKLAARRLESADQNMTRLGDIIAEVERQMRHLKRQVNAATRYRELTTELKVLEVRDAWLKHNELLNRLEDVAGQLAEAQNQYAAASAELGSLEAEAEQLNLRRLELDQELAACREREASLDAEMERVERDTALARQEIAFSRQRVEEIQAERAALEKKMEDTSPSTGVDGELERLDAALRTVREELETLQERLTDADRAVRAGEERLESLRAAAMAVTATRHRAESELNGTQSALAALEQQIAELRQHQSAQAEQLAALSARETEARQAAEAARRALEEIEASRRDVARRRAEVTELVRQLESTRQEKRETRSGLEARSRSLKELRDRYEGFAGGVRAIMLARQQGLAEMDGIIGPVGDLISAEKGFETAIEAALGGNINNVVTRDAEAAKRAIAFLKTHQAGRVTFLPLDTIRSGGTDEGEPLPGVPGVIGWATRHVTCPAELKPAVEYLLYNTVIVRDIDDAIRIARTERRYPRLVTLEGEVVSPAGAVTGGRTRHESRGLIGRSAEIEELERQVADLDQELAHLDRQVDNARDTLKTLEVTARDLENREAAARRETASREAALAAVESERAALDRSGGRLAEQDAGLLTRSEELREKAGSFLAVLEEARAEESETQARLNTAREELETLRANRAAMEQAVADQRVRAAEAARALDEARRLREREERERASAREELARREEMTEQLRCRIAALEQAVSEHAERAANLSAEREAAHARTLEAIQAHQQVVASLDALAERNRAARSRLESAGKALHAAELTRAQMEDRLAFFRQLVERDYGLNLDTLSEEEIGSDDLEDTEREERIREIRRQLERLGNVNLAAIEEYQALEERERFLKAQAEDLRQARDTLMGVIHRIDETITRMFLETFNKVGDYFRDYFRRLFNGGQARLYLADESDPLECGIEIEARPPGKKPQSIALLSGGEQALTAIALLMAIFSAKPSPFCVLDEVDAPLDDANVERFLDMVTEFSSQSQFIIITHNKQTMARADALFGVTQQEPGVSQIVSVRLEDAPAG